MNLLFITSLSFLGIINFIGLVLRFLFSELNMLNLALYFFNSSSATQIKLLFKLQQRNYVNSFSLRRGSNRMSIKNHFYFKVSSDQEERYLNKSMRSSSLEALDEDLFVLQSIQNRSIVFFLFYFGFGEVSFHQLQPGCEQFPQSVHLDIVL